MSNPVHAQWVQEQGQVELRTYQPSTGLKPRTDPFEYQLLGLVRCQWRNGKPLQTFQAVFRAPPDSPVQWRDVTAPRGTPPQDYQNDLANQVAAMHLVDAKFRERNPGTVLRVSGDAPQILRGPLLEIVR